MGATLYASDRRAATVPDGTIQRVSFTPWDQLEYDGNDTVLDSDWYAERTALVPGEVPPFSGPAIM